MLMTMIIVINNIHLKYAGILRKSYDHFNHKEMQNREN